MDKQQLRKLDELAEMLEQPLTDAREAWAKYQDAETDGADKAERMELREQALEDGDTALIDIAACIPELLAQAKLAGVA